jgi:putative addiction module component (TIGR02574 family)
LYIQAGGYVAPIPIEKMSLDEKFALMEALWESIRAHPEQLRTPESHLNLIRTRLAEFETNKDDGQDADEFLRELEQRNK